MPVDPSMLMGLLGGGGGGGQGVGLGGMDGAQQGAVMGFLNARRAKDLENRNRTFEATQTRFSPWTGVMGKRVDAGPTFLEGTVKGAMDGKFAQEQHNQDMEQYAADKDYKATLLELLKKQLGGGSADAGMSSGKGVMWAGPDASSFGGLA